MLSIAIENDQAAEAAAEITARLIRFNESKAGPLNRRPLTLSVRDDRGTIVAGLTGESFWNGLYVNILFVDEAGRQQGLGSALLQRAEAIARERDCSYVYLSTFEFQAPGFYVKQGYTAFGELADVPRGSRRVWFAKRVAD